MHRLRSTVKAVEAGATLPPLSAREECRRSPVQDGSAPTGDRRKAPQRRVSRHRGLLERAAVTYRGKKALVGIVNLSRGGATIETRIAAEVGDSLTIELPGTGGAPATVRWTHRGLVGLDFGETELPLPA